MMEKLSFYFSSGFREFVKTQPTPFLFTVYFNTNYSYDYHSLQCKFNAISSGSFLFYIDHFISDTVLIAKYAIQGDTNINEYMKKNFLKTDQNEIFRFEFDKETIEWKYTTSIRRNVCIYMNDLQYTYDFINQGVCLGDKVGEHKIINYDLSNGLIKTSSNITDVLYSECFLYWKPSDAKHFKDNTCLGRLSGVAKHDNVYCIFLFKHYLDREEFEKFLILNYDNNDIPLLNTLDSDCIEIIASYIGCS